MTSYTVNVNYKQMYKRKNQTTRGSAFVLIEIQISSFMAWKWY